MIDYHSAHLHSTYFAPRGRKRMYALGAALAQQYLSPDDHLIGIIGEAGSGKSALIKGMFPGLELTNDDDGVNVRPLPILDVDMERGFFSPHTYHLDIRFENGFTQMNVLADAIVEALHRRKRVVVEHFDLVYPFLKQNASLLIGIGEEVLITRPTLFGPEPQFVADIVYKSLPYRLMAHSAEDLCEMYIPDTELSRCQHGDIRHGFTMIFKDNPPDIDIKAMEAHVNDMIQQDLPISYKDENHIMVGDICHECTGPRTHMPSTGKIEGFRLLDHFIYDRFEKCYILVGGIGEKSEDNLNHLDHMYR